MAEVPNFPPVPESDEVANQKRRDLEDRLTADVLDEEAAKGAINAKLGISLALAAGKSAREIIEEKGGIEEVERLVGPKAAGELRQQAEREEE